MLSTAKQRVRKAFDRSAPVYDRYAGFQAEIACELARLAVGGASGGVVLDIGCGTGRLAEELARGGAFEKIIACDISMNMGLKARERMAGLGPVSVVQADTEALPLRDGCVDMVVSNMSLQWVDSLDVAFGQIARTLKSGGRFMGVTLGEGTFRELRGALAAAGADDMSRGFLPEPEIGEKIRRAGFDARTWASPRARNYASARDFLMTLKKVGANGVSGLSAPGLGRRGVMARLERAYAENFSDASGVRATYELVFIDAVKN